MLHVIEQELHWRKQHGRAEGFESLRASRPTVAVGAERPLEDQLVMADYFRMLETLHPTQADVPKMATTGSGASTRV